MNLESVWTDIRKYIDVRFEESRLKVAGSVSSLVSQIVSFLIISFLATVLVCLLLVALMQWLNELLGVPWGTLIAAGGLAVIIVVLFLLRKRLLAGALGKAIAGALGSDTDNPEKDLSKLKKERARLERKFDITLIFSTIRKICKIEEK